MIESVVFNMASAKNFMDTAYSRHIQHNLLYLFAASPKVSWSALALLYPKRLWPRIGK